MPSSYEISATAPAQRESSMQTMLEPFSRLLRADVLILLLIFTAFHYYKLSTFQISIDDEFEALRDNGYNWIVSGRWSAFVFLRYFLPQPILPFFPAVLFGLGVAVSYPLLLSCFGVRRLETVHYLAFPVYAGFPTWIFLTSLTTACCWAGIAQLTVVAALDRFRRVFDPASSSLFSKRTVVATNTLLCVVALAVAIGFYQAFLTSFLVLGLGMLLVAPQVGIPSARQTAQRVIALGVVTVLGLALYAMIDGAIRHAFGLYDTSYLGGMFHLQALLDAPLSVLRQTARSIAATYAGHPAIYGSEIVTFPIILLGGIAAILLWPRESTGSRLWRLVLIASILCCPFALHLINNGWMPLRTYVAIPMVFWLFAMFGLTSRVRAIAFTSLLATLVGLVQILYATNQYYAAGHFARMHDQALAAVLYARVAEMNPDFDAQKTYTVDFFGARPFTTNYPRPESSTLAYSFFEWDGGNEDRMLRYMRLLGYTNLVQPSGAQRQKDLDVFKTMPTWPANGSVRVHDGVTLVKLGPNAGWPFNTQGQ